VDTATFTLPDPADIWRMSPLEKADYVRWCMEFANRCYAFAGAICAVVEDEGVKAVYGDGSTRAWFDECTLMGVASAAKIVKRGCAVNPSHRIDGSVVPALAPLTGAAALEGVLTPEHVDRIVEVMGKIPDAITDEERAGAEQILVNLARTARPSEVRLAGNRLLNTLDQDGSEPKDEPLPERPKRELHFQEHRDGTATLKGTLDQITYAQLRSVLDPLAEPVSSKEEGPDLRSKAERYADALAEAIQLAMTSEELPTHAGAQAHVVVTIDFEALKSGIGQATLDGGWTISANEARLLACDCSIIPALLARDGEVLDLGRTQRIVTPGQRRVLVLRDGGCSFPGCHKKPKNCEAHHIVWWINDGPTNILNLTLLCSRHHRVIHRGHWEVRMAADGKPEFIPPVHLDRHRRPRRNTIHV
jgi:hypothetical protein